MIQSVGATYPCYILTPRCSVMHLLECECQINRFLGERVKYKGLFHHLSSDSFIYRTILLGECFLYMQVVKLYLTKNHRMKCKHCTALSWEENVYEYLNNQFFSTVQSVLNGFLEHRTHTENVHVIKKIMFFCFRSWNSNI